MFDGILGNEGVKSLLQRLVDAKRLPSALLFAGKEGIGKKLFAIRIAQSLVCASGTENRPCLNCPACKRASEFAFPSPKERDDHKQLIFSGHPDVGMVIPYSHTILIDAVRHLEREANFRPFEATARVFIIDEAEKLSSVKDNAANALLKTLEEPSETTHIILITSRPLLLLSTIRSRCQTVRFGLLEKELIAEHLMSKVGYAPDDAALVAGLSQGSIGRALQIELGTFRDLRNRLVEVVIRCSRGDNFAALLRASEELADPKAKDSFGESLDILQTLVHDAWILQKDPRAEVVNYDLRDELSGISEVAGSDRLSSWMKEIEALRENLNFNLNKRLATDALFMTMASGES